MIIFQFINQMRLIRMSYHLSTIESIYQSSSIEKRIELFSNLQIRTNQVIQPLNIIDLPSLISTSPKQLRQFVIKNQIPNNIRILHALAHIQYNAFMSYVDTTLRFKHHLGSNEQDFIDDMRRIALQQGFHFMLLKKRLIQEGYDYGSLPVITKLHNAIQSTKHDLLSRIAIISLVHEGKGIKATRKLQHQIQKLGDERSLQVLRLIQSEQKGHFINGIKWFRIACGCFNLRIQQQIDKINSIYKSKMNASDII